MTNEENTAMFNSVILLGQNTLKAALAINVVFAVAALLLLGKLVGIMADLGTFTLNGIDVVALITAFWILTLNSAAVAVAFGLSYVAQFMYAMQLKQYGSYVHAVVAVLTVWGYLGFIIGGYYIYQVF